MIAVASHSLLTGLILLSGALLSACDRESGSNALENDPFAVRSTAKEDQFGQGFGKAFRADPNSEPANVVEDDVLPVSYIDEPAAID